MRGGVGGLRREAAEGGGGLGLRGGEERLRGGVGGLKGGGVEGLSGVVGR